MPRLTACTVLLVASCLVVSPRAEPVAAQEKTKPTVAGLEKQVTQLKSELQTAQQQNATLKAEVAALKAANAQMEAALKKLNPSGDPAVPGLLAAISAFRNAGLVHVVILKLKSGSSDGEGQSVIDDAYSQLATVKSVRGLWAGKPSGSGTPDAFTDYTVGLVVLFDDAAGLKTYLNDPIHTKFADKHLKKWETPTVYDFAPTPPVPPPVNPTVTSKTLQPILDGYRGAGLVHVVVLKLKSDTTAGEAQAVLDDVYAQLSTIKAVRGVWAGKPVSKGSPNAVTDYNVALTLLFDDAAGLKAYLNDPIHTKFADKHLKKWETPTVYDFEPKSPSP
jgi:hypothetical protein